MYFACGLEETEGHTHDETCYEGEETLTCGKEEGEGGHVHTGDCYTRVRGELICENEDEDHEHDDSCYEWDEELTCGQEEGEGGHVHTEECYTLRRVLTCGQEEAEPHTHTEDCRAQRRVLTCERPELAESHTHTEECYAERRVLSCGLEETAEEHVHGEECFTVLELTDEEVQALQEGRGGTQRQEQGERPAWEEAMDGLDLRGKDAAVDLLAVAKAQLGYRESEENYLLDEEGVRRGYTWYGDWYGTPYADWNTLFVGFCLHYAEITEKEIPFTENVDRWIEDLMDAGLYTAAPCVPQPGDLVFLTPEDEDGFLAEGAPLRAAIVLGVELVERPAAEGSEEDAASLSEEGETAPDQTETAMEELSPDDPIDGEAAGEAEARPETQEPALSALRVIEGGGPEGVREHDVVPKRVAGMAALPQKSGGASTPSTEEMTYALRFTGSAAGMLVVAEAEESTLPEGASLSVSAVEEETLLDTVSALVPGTVVRAVDITFLDADGEAVEPSLPVRVHMTPEETVEADRCAVVHMGADGAELVEQTEDGEESVTFQAEAFSVYALVYTVDFAHGEYTYSLGGGSSILISELLDTLGIDAQGIASAVFSNEDLVSLTPITAGDGRMDYLLTSRQPFHTQETLTVTMADGAAYTIAVTDEQSTDAKVQGFTYKFKTGGTLSSDGRYVWSAENQEPGHRFVFVVDYTMSGTGDLEPGAVEIRVPVHILKDENGNDADNFELSVPLKEEAGAQNEYAYEHRTIDGMEYIVISNIVPIPAAQGGYFELSYNTALSTFFYPDLGKNSPFTAALYLNGVKQEPSAGTPSELNVGIDTQALIVSTEKKAPSTTAPGRPPGARSRRTRRITCTFSGRWRASLTPTPPSAMTLH